jgi:hypothetical protein
MRGWPTAADRLGDLAGARANRTAQRGILEGLLATDPQNVPARTDLLPTSWPWRLDAAAGRTPRPGGLDRGRAEPALLKLARRPRDAATRPARSSCSRCAPSFDAGGQPPRRPPAAGAGRCAPTGPSTTRERIARFCQFCGPRPGGAGDARARRGRWRGRPAPGGDVLSARWGLDFAEEARLAGG